MQVSPLIACPLFSLEVFSRLWHKEPRTVSTTSLLTVYGSFAELRTQLRVVARLMGLEFAEQFTGQQESVWAKGPINFQRTPITYLAKY